MAIRAVIFDLGGVLSRSDPTERRTEALASVGLTEHMLSAITRANPVMQQSFIGKASKDEASAACAKEICERFSISESLWALINAEVNNWWDEELLNYALQLRSRVKIALLSDARLHVREGIKKHVNAGNFDVIVISAEVGMRKPDPGIYLLTLEQLGVAPDEAIFVDDWAPNIEGARALGIHGILFQNTEQAKADIQALLDS